MIIRHNQSLSLNLFIRLAITAFLSVLLLIAVVAVRYSSASDNVQRIAMNVLAETVAREMLRGGTIPALFAKYPESYGFRALDRSRLTLARTLAAANVGVIPTNSLYGEEADHNTEPRLVEGLRRFDATFAAGGLVTWVYTLRHQGHPLPLWIQVAMRGDPAHLWRSSLLDELVDHVLLPAMVIIPTLGLTLFMATRRALEPLHRIAERARRLGLALADGVSIEPLSETGLVREFQDLVSSFNAVLHRLDRSLALQGQFTSDAAHELRTPLAVMRLEVSNLPPGESRRRLAEQIDNLAARVTQLLHFARAEETVSERMAPLDLVEVARSVTMELAAEAVLKSRFVAFLAPAEPVAVRGHAELISIAVRNLIENALRFAPRDSEVVVEVGADRTVVVSDHGPGVEDADKHMVFQRFWRGRTETSEGSGIGLALVKRVAELHHGGVSVRDNVGGGAIFTLRLGAAAAMV